MSPTPSATPAIPIASMYAVTVFPYTGDWNATRAAYTAAHNGQQGAPYNPNAPIQLFDAPDPPNPNPVPCFDPNNAAGGYVDELVIANPANIPGAYTYPARVVAPTAATFMLFGGLVLPVSANSICSEADAQALVPLFEAVPAFAGKAVTINSTALDPGSVTWGTETRRFWGIAVAGVPGTLNCAALCAAANMVNGVVPPGAFVWAPPVQEPNAAPGINWVAAEQVTTPPANAATAPIPIYPLPPGYQIAVIGKSLFNQAGTFVVQPIPSPAPTLAEQLADLQAQIAALTAQEQALLAQLGESS